MKKIVLAIAAASLALPGAAIAQPAQRGDNHGAHVSAAAHDNRGQQQRNANQQHRFRQGEHFDRSRATNYRQIDYRQVRGLSAPRDGYRYVQSGDDILMVAIGSGIVGAVIGGLLN